MHCGLLPSSHALAPTQPRLAPPQSRTILVVNDQAIYRDLFIAALGANGYRTLWAASSREALDILQSAWPDLVLIDVTMPETDAWHFIETARTLRPATPLDIFLLTAVADKDCILRARELGVRECFLKSSFSFEDLLGRVNRRLGRAAEPAEPPSLPRAPPPAAEQKSAEAVAIAPAPAAKDRALTRKEIAERIEQSGELKTLQGVVLRVLEVANAPNSSVEDIVPVLSQDPVLACGVLRAANSAAYLSRRGRIATICDAVKNIGLDAVCSLAVSIGIVQSFAESGPASGELLRWWQHSNAVANIMDRLIPSVGPMPVGLPHMIGLCHDLGEIALRQQFAPEFQLACDRAAETGVSLEEAERGVFGASHQELLQMLWPKMGIPHAIAAPISEFHASRGPRLSPVAQALSLANTIAHGLLLAPSPAARIRPFGQNELSSPPGGEKTFAFDLHTLHCELIADDNLLAGLSPSQEVALSRPLLPYTGLNVWYARDPALAGIDPLELALSFMAQTNVYDKPPQSCSEIAGVDALVMSYPKNTPVKELLEKAQAVRETLRNSDFPILCLSTHGAEAPFNLVGNTEFAKYPIQLGSLHRFIVKSHR